ncbi:MAG: alpha/beta hydrolase, partial [Actinobacteria bacterium]|nr:alpha/beta hydrolase [Actinomycetota bacterium]
SSMGGLASLYALAKRPDFFSTALALSPHWVIGEKPLAEWLIKSLPDPHVHKVWMSRGTKGLDAQYETTQKHADKLMTDKNYRIGKDFETKIYSRTGHNEKSWASYLDQVLDFWLT